MPNAKHTHIERLDSSRERSWLHYANLSLRWNELGNGRSADMSKHLFSIAALILPILLIPVTKESSDLSSNLFGKILLILSWFSFVISLISGLIHLSKEIIFFDDWAEQESSKSKVFIKPIRTVNERTAYNLVSKMHDNADKLDKLPKTMSQKFLRWQQFSLVIGIVFIGSLLFTKICF